MQSCIGKTLKVNYQWFFKNLDGKPTALVKWPLIWVQTRVNAILEGFKLAV